jgi:uncharacterized protein YbjT (DUF2867 family)
LKVVLFGATGMIGAGVLEACLADPRVDSVLAVGRAPTGRKHEKLQGLVRTGFFDFSDAPEALAGHDACFFCLGVSSAAMDEAKYHRLTYDLTIAAAAELARISPGATFCYVSGQGTDSTEHGRIMWARVKGKTENRLLELPLDTYLFRPGYVQPMKGIRSKTALYRAVYTVLGPFFPVLRRLAPRYVTGPSARDPRSCRDRSRRHDRCGSCHASPLRASRAC